MIEDHADLSPREMLVFAPMLLLVFLDGNLSILVPAADAAGCSQSN